MTLELILGRKKQSIVMYNDPSYCHHGPDTSRPCNYALANGACVTFIAAWTWIFSDSGLCRDTASFGMEAEMLAKGIGKAYAALDYSAIEELSLPSFLAVSNGRIWMPIPKSETNFRSFCLKTEPCILNLKPRTGIEYCKTWNKTLPTTREN